MATNPYEPPKSDAPVVSAEAVEISPDDDGREWLAKVYQGDKVPQLTLRAVITGMLIGGVMSISNLYVGLKTGWGLGVTITACIIAFAVFKTLEQIIPAFQRRPFSILENYTMSSAASAAGYMSSAGLVSAIPALYLTTHTQMSWWQMMCWLGAVSFLGVFMAVPLKRQLINIDKLPFPSGIATAETLRSMHSSGVEAMQKAKSLLSSALCGAGVALWGKGLRDLWGGRFEKYALPEEMPLVPGEQGHSLMERNTFGLEGSLIMVAAGAIMGIRVGVSLLIGAIIYYGVIGEELIAREITKPGYGGKGINSWTLWPATSMMVTGGLLAFGLRWRTILRAFSGLTAIFGRKGGDRDDPLAAIEVPGSWFILGTFTAGAACVIFGWWFFGISWWMGVLAVLLTFLLSIVAARATGETDVTPIGAMGKITQLTYGALAPPKIVGSPEAALTTNLMTAAITAGAASHSADLLTDLKSGYLLGGNSRKQTISQFFGVVAGTVFCVPVYLMIVKPEELGTPSLPAPAAKVWAGVAQVLSEGWDKLPVGAGWGILVGGLVGIALTLLEEFTPKKHRYLIPSSTGLGIAGVIPAFNSVSMFLGAFIAWVIAKSNPRFADKYTIASSSGLIAGETLTSVAIIFIVQGPGMWRQFMEFIFGPGS